MRKTKLRNFFRSASVFFQLKSKERIRLEELFDWQIEQLRENGIPKEVLSGIERKREKVLDHSFYFSSAPRYYETIPFLIVVPLGTLERFFSIPLSIINKAGLFDGSLENIHKSIDTEDVHNIQSIIEFSEPYFVYNLENGMNERSISGVSPLLAQNLLEKTKMSPLSLSEVLSLLIIFPNIYNVKGEKITVMGSRYRNENLIPEFLKNDKGFQLQWSFLYDLGANRVYPACWERKFF